MVWNCMLIVLALVTYWKKKKKKKKGITASSFYQRIRHESNVSSMIFCSLIINECCCRDYIPAKTLCPTNPEHPRRDVLALPSFFWHTCNQTRKGLCTCSNTGFEPAHFFRELPANRKLSNIVSIFKKDKKKEPGNYRLISLTSVLLKLWRRLLCVILKIPKRQCSSWS